MVFAFWTVFLCLSASFCCSDIKMTTINESVQQDAVVIRLFENEQNAGEQFVALLPDGKVVDDGIIFTSSHYLLKDVWLGHSKKN